MNCGTIKPKLKYQTLNLSSWIKLYILLLLYSRQKFEYFIFSVGIIMMIIIIIIIILIIIVITLNGICE